MEEKEVISILRHYRHDLLNQLQIVQGYVSMGNTDKANTKIREYVQNLHEERKLTNLNVPKFALYLIQFNSLHTNFRLSYHIQAASGNLPTGDEPTLEHCRRIIRELEDESDKSVLYEVNLKINEDTSTSVVKLEFDISGSFPDTGKLISNLENTGLDMNVKQSENGIFCSLRVPYQ